MNTAVHAVPIRSIVVDTSKRKQEVSEVIGKVKKLRQLTKETGFFTNRSIGALLAPLSPDELVEVYDALNITPCEKPRQ